MNEMAQIIRVLIADDHAVVRAGIRAALEKAPDIQIVGEAQDGAEVQQLVAELQPDVLLLDLRMPGLRPTDLEAWVRQRYPEIATLVLTAHDRNAYLTAMIDAGVAGYLIKSERLDQLAESVRRAARGEVFITGGQLARAYQWRIEVGERWRKLTQRERQVLRLMAEGLTNAAIAERLGVAPKTVEYHVTHLARKLGCASRPEAIVWAHHHLKDLDGDWSD
jgi:DNA-binding NarL/FixJ family response regulator